ncbi:FtsQ-type POTRA domain-containing protein [Sporolactobacillus sp. THM7-4]|nr:FtsQ-type POTRA domain-containing protein [Sporolactobacillus sp. THM7-4]
MNGKKIVPLEDRLPQLKKERKQKANRRFALYASIFFLLILLVVYFQSPLSKVQQITVDGEQLISSDKIIQASGISRQTHIWDIRPDQAQKHIEQLPTVQAVSVHPQFPNHVLIRIKEFDRKAYLYKNGGYYPILQNGTMLKKLPDGKLPVDAPVLFGFTDKGALKTVAEGLAKIPQQVIHTISDIHYISKPHGGEDLILYMNDGNRVLASTVTFQKNIELYPEIAAGLQKNGSKGTIHLSIGSYFVPDRASKNVKDSGN